MSTLTVGGELRGNVWDELLANTRYTACHRIDGQGPCAEASSLSGPNGAVTAGYRSAAGPLERPMSFFVRPYKLGVRGTGPETAPNTHTPAGDSLSYTEARESISGHGILTTLKYIKHRQKDMGMC